MEPIMIYARAVDGKVTKISRKHHEVITPE
jgi:hypothetical protein